MKLKNLLFPPRCPFCGKIMPEEIPCPQCLAGATELTGTVCRVCGAYPAQCVCGRNVFAFERNVSAYYYEGAPRNLLLRFKERNCPQLAGFMAKRMFRQIEGRLGRDFSFITYVPGAVSGALRRGYCPARLLAEALSPLLGVPILEVLRRRTPRQQKFLSAAGRWENAKTGYALRRGVGAGGKILLIDDLTTTGATLSACASLLKEAGAESVFCATFAITPKKS